jgi:hypothetical protein
VKLLQGWGGDYKNYYKYENFCKNTYIKLLLLSLAETGASNSEENPFKSEKISSIWNNQTIHFYLRYSYLWLRLMRLRLLKWRLSHH